MEKALRDWMDAQDAERWNAERLMQGEPHPCDGCEVACSGSCRFWFVKGYAERPKLHPIFQAILDMHTRRVV